MHDDDVNRAAVAVAHDEDESEMRRNLTASALAKTTEGQRILDYSSRFLTLGWKGYNREANVFVNREKYFEDGFVYLMRAKGTNFYKIGKSINPKRRLKQIYPKMPFETELVLHLQTDFMSEAEAWLHRLWSQRRANGEWFDLGDYESYCAEHGDVDYASLIGFLPGTEHFWMTDYVWDGFSNFLADLHVQPIEQNWLESQGFHLSPASFFDLLMDIEAVHGPLHYGRETVLKQISAKEA